MRAAWMLYRERGAAALWQRCLGFMDASVEEALAGQHRDLEAQLQSMRIGAALRKSLGGPPLAQYAELREAAPLTTYDDHLDTLGERRSETLTEAPSAWLRTSGRADGKPKWVPLAPRAHAELPWVVLACCLAATARERGDVRLREDARVLNLTAPPPYMTGTAAATLDQIWPVRLYPSVPNGDGDEPFEELLARAFRSALTDRVDVVLSYASVLAGVGAAFGQQQQLQPLAGLRRHPRAAARLMRARLRSRISGRAVYPRDLWQLQGTVTGAMDSTVFRERVRQYWGPEPLDLLASTEALFFGIQTRDQSTMTLIPHFNFFEFLPIDDDVDDAVRRHDRRAETCTMDSLEAGRRYELVVTSLRGGPFVRYRTGDVLRAEATPGSIPDVSLPQFTYAGRLSELLEVAGFARLTEQVVRAALQLAGVECVDWAVRKELEDGTPIVHLLIEARAGYDVPENDIERRVHDALSAVDGDWADMERIAGLRPLRVTRLASGAFERLARERSVNASLPLKRMQVRDAHAAALLRHTRVESRS